MEYALIVGVIIIALVFVLMAAGKGGKGEPELQYRLMPHLLSKAELGFYGPLLQATNGHDVSVFSKVRIADVLAPVKNPDRKIWQRAFNAISSKHFDFVVCRDSDSRILLAIELDDKSHSTQKAQKRDRIVNSACQTAGLPLLRFAAKRGYVIADIRTELDKVLSPVPTSTTPVVEAQPEATANKVPVSKSNSEEPTIELPPKLSTSKMAKAMKLSTADFLMLLEREGYLRTEGDIQLLTERALISGAEAKTGRSGQYFVWPTDLVLEGRADLDHQDT